MVTSRLWARVQVNMEGDRPGCLVPGLTELCLDDDEIHQEDTWEVISAYFEDKGLVRQQLDSFNEFIGTTIQEVPIRCGPAFSPRDDRLWTITTVSC
jgi:DNA-directed RNA polymerase beta subunit